MRPVSCFLVVIFAIINFSCESKTGKHIPEKHPDLSEGTYGKYIGLLNEAYDANDKLGAAFQLSNLKAEKEITYKFLNSAIEEDLSKCEEIYEWYYLYDRHGFGMNIVKLDTLLFKKSVELCITLNKENSYENYAALKDKEEKDAKANKPKEDSTGFNLLLVKQLEQIHFDDQDIRKRVRSKNITPKLKDELSKEMNLIDSINLVKIDKIFKEFGYPSRELVGRECSFTPALVIHHSKDLVTRYKYLPFLEKAVEERLLSEGTLNMIKVRVEQMELDED